jgi:hypothetical protein
MKIVTAIISCAILVACSRYNNIKSQKKAPLVHVRDWGYSAMSFGEGFWESYKDTIVSQIGAAEFEKLKASCGFKKVPSTMSIYDGKNKPDVKKFNERMTGLKVYKIAAYTLTSNLKDGKKLHERMNILRCPYKGNENWNLTTKWDTVYFAVHEEFVEPIK